MNTLTIILLALSAGFNLLLLVLLVRGWREINRLLTANVDLQCRLSDCDNEMVDARLRSNRNYRAWIHTEICFWFLWCFFAGYLIWEWWTRRKNAAK